tara:strand:- start:202 stop:837 length:636 start_codon:yes stop_codon:yes gene_type:complete
MKSCVILFNCHGKQIEIQINQCKEFTSIYKISHIELLYYLPNGTFVKDYYEDKDLELIKNADLLIIQSMRQDRSYLNFDYVAKLIKKDCLTIKIPHYSSSIYWFFNNSINDDNLEYAKNNFIKNELEHIKNLDEISDIKIYDFFINNYKNKQLFYGRWYPTYFLFNYISQIILYKLNINIQIKPIFTNYVTKKSRIQLINNIDKKLLNLNF